MTDSTMDQTNAPAIRRESPHAGAAAAARLKARRRSERRFKAYGLGAVLLAITMLVVLLSTLAGQGLGAFTQTQVAVEVNLDPALLDPEGNRDLRVIGDANYTGLMTNIVRDNFGATQRRDILKSLGVFSRDARFELRDFVLENPELIGTTQTIWLTASGDIDMLDKGWIDRDLPEDQRRVDDRVLGWYDALDAKDAVDRAFNVRFFTGADSRSPELAGIWGATVGSALTLFICFILSFPIGVTTAIYLEEFAPKNRWTDLIEVNINNLAAVPSIVFGLLGLAVFIGFFGMPRSAPVVGGFTLALMTLPTIIIATRAALKAVPPSIRQAAQGLGASPVQVVFHHVLPLAMPGVLTGTILGMAQALGETAPLLMIGMVAFIADTPGGFSSPATVLPVQIFLWADSPERAFVEKTAAAILVLLSFLILMNAIAIVLRRRFERRW
ncbi:phosphate transport system permease protein PstA [Tistrella bauzanensis]|uniref:Phosphate transport system permease protein PstA n=1 Tax=Tistrella bauzanensis TaxID=657419 RepID=A0ABQ1IY45_9PROT|nr:phosphate ABC transporter permease PstA [Tistrella bauzanensis]GGB54093.1 phosphate transport system permease protein PstA [Tistrella bauzanensis]